MPAGRNGLDRPLRQRWPQRRSSRRWLAKQTGFLDYPKTYTRGREPIKLTFGLTFEPPHKTGLPSGLRPPTKRVSRAASVFNIATPARNGYAESKGDFSKALERRIRFNSLPLRFSLALRFSLEFASIRLHCGFRLHSLDCADLDWIVWKKTQNTTCMTMCWCKAGYRLLAGYIPACM